MRDVIYVGVANVRILDENDFAALGVDHKHTIEFQRGVARELSNRIAGALEHHPLVVGEFVVMEQTDSEDDETPDDSNDENFDPKDRATPVVRPGEGGPEPDPNAIVNDSSINEPSSTTPEEPVKKSGRATR